MLIENINGITALKADDGKAIQHKENAEITGKTIWLGKNDSADNYIEIDEPIIELEEII